jgi:hypothetical protein
MSDAEAPAATIFVSALDVMLPSCLNAERRL